MDIATLESIVTLLPRAARSVRLAAGRELATPVGCCAEKDVCHQVGCAVPVLAKKATVTLERPAKRTGCARVVEVVAAAVVVAVGVVVVVAAAAGVEAEAELASQGKQHAMPSACLPLRSAATTVAVAFAIAATTATNGAAVV
jgi:hypothetical protein